MFEGGDGVDTVYIDDGAHDVSVLSYDDDGSLFIKTVEEIDRLKDIEFLDLIGGAIYKFSSGDSSDDTLPSQHGAWDIMNAGAGDDQIAGSGGAYIIRGAGSDTVDAGGSNDNSLGRRRWHGHCCWWQRG